MNRSGRSQYIECSALATPALTTIRIDAHGFGRRAARALLSLEPGTPPLTPAQVVTRDSA